MKNLNKIFRGVEFRGSELLPRDITPSLEGTRRWVYKNGLVWNQEVQFVTPERVEEARKYFGPKNQLYVLARSLKKIVANLIIMNVFMCLSPR